MVLDEDQIVAAGDVERHDLDRESPARRGLDANYAEAAGPVLESGDDTLVTALEDVPGKEIRANPAAGRIVAPDAIAPQVASTEPSRLNAT
ncbi:hypothetical protein [Aestuariicoccus sp. MJ-SS9]|uniref:hypothetical protein n=1 Tax=Aestuariicoccus sp. MJ-SS9 TaxID=3079855 RepID=UPI00290AFDE9|nr:hypothetical protein [Aestuariicoccus sp. MJ-SS9]MDU8910446.1 hypothetical protein [Aestuariicoccus sp. MJ-SS9]